MLRLLACVKAPSTWRINDPRAAKADSEFRRVRPLVLRRDRYACRGCGLRDPSLRLEVHHLDNNHHNNRMINLVSACVYCHAVFHAGFHGRRGARGAIASRWWLADDPAPPGLQAEISRWALGFGGWPGLPPGDWMSGEECEHFIGHLTLIAEGRHPEPETIERLRGRAVWCPDPAAVRAHPARGRRPDPR